MGWWDDFTGKSARNDLAAGKDAANKEITGGETAGRADYDAGIARLDPYATGGEQGLDAYLASLGLRGTQAQQEVQGRYMADPIQNALMDRITKANTRQQTGRGMGNSGAATQSLTNALLASWGSYQDRLKGVGDTGVQAAGGQSTLEAGKGDMAFGAGQQRAGIDIGSANALAASRSTGVNNILAAAGVGLKAFGVGGYGVRKAA